MTFLAWQRVFLKCQGKSCTAFPEERGHSGPDGSSENHSKDGKRVVCLQHLAVQLLNNHMAHGQFMAKTADSAQQLFSLSIRICPLIVGCFFPPLASLWVTNDLTAIKLLAVFITCAKVKCLLSG